VDRHSRQELKTDKFVEEVGQTVHFLDAHRKQVYLYGVIAVVVLALGVGGYYYSKVRRNERQEAFFQAMLTENATVSSEARPNATRWFHTDAEKEAAVRKEFGDIIKKYSGSREAYASSYMLGVFAADQGNLQEAEAHLRRTAQEASDDYASMAKLALADILAAQGKEAEAEKLLRDLMAKPTLTVSKEQATMNLAHIIARTRKDEARKLLEPLRGQVGPVSRAAISAYAALDAK
jgi:predicted negative regulator of RcsB-dependent stress response